MAYEDSIDLIGENAPLQYQLLENEQLIGFIEYYVFDRISIVTHTEVNPALGGKGHGSRLACHALHFFSDQGKQVVPICGFFAHYLRRNPQFAQVVTPESRRIFDINPPA